MYIIFRLVCENFSKIAVKVSFLWGQKHDYTQQRHFQQMWHRDVQITTCRFSLLLFCMSSSYLSHSDCLVVILKFYTVPMFLQAVRNSRHQKLCKLESIFKQTRVNFFYRKNMMSFSQLCHNYAKGPFCVTWLILGSYRWKVRWYKMIFGII